jgi:[ribosomal protein S18]-alanine N-acetyltransferase
VSPAACTDSAALASLHRQAFDEAWEEEAFAELLASPGAFAYVAGEPPEGFILCRAIAGDSEVLTLAVTPPFRRQGVARALLQAALVEARRRGAEAMFLEVATDNAPAAALYRGAGFTQAGLRRGYYPDGSDALVMRRELAETPCGPG